ncbi:hypothetical protein COAQ111491_05895 [Comamonas aquatilis]
MDPDPSRSSGAPVMARTPACVLTFGRHAALPSATRSDHSN